MHRLHELQWTKIFEDGGEGGDSEADMRLLCFRTGYGYSSSIIC